MALHLFGTDVQQSDGGALQPENGAGERLAHDGEIDQLLRIGFHIGADIENHALALARGPQRRDRRAVDPIQHAQLEHGYRHKRAGVPRRDRDLRLVFLQRLDGPPHAGIAAPPDDLAGLVVHANRLSAVAHLDAACQLAAAREQGLELGLVAMQQEAHAGMTDGRACQGGHDDARAGIAAHGIDGNGQVLGHQSPRKPLCGKPAKDAAAPGLRLRLRLHGLPAIIIAASCANVMGAPLLAAIGAFDVGRRHKPVMGAPHVSPRRRFLSLGDRHGGATPSKMPNRNGGRSKRSAGRMAGEKQGAE